MLLTSVILVLQETLEAALLVSILAVVSLQLRRRPTWLVAGFGVGGPLAWLYAANIQRVSEWFDYVGQELINAGIQIAISAVLVTLGWFLGRDLLGKESGSASDTASRATGFGLLCALAVMLAVTREGSEIMVFLGGFIGQDEQVEAVLVGSTIGFGIGVSAGALLFYALLPLDGPRGRWLPIVLLALFAGNMLSQAVLQLVQADWLQSGQVLWDSSGWLPEHSVPGRLLYALVGYESNPSGAQVAGYLVGAAAVLGTALLGRRLS